LKRLLTTILTFFIAGILYAQPTVGGSYQEMKGQPSNSSKTGYGKISGQIIDENQQPVPFATISLINISTSKTIDGTIADDQGKFSIRNIPAGTFKVNISFIGYDPVVKSSYEITGKGESYDLGMISLAPNVKELDEVVVEGKKELMEEKVDRIIYNAEQDKTTLGGDASDVLRRVPMISVDLDGNVSLRGSSNIKVLIDNRPSTISASSIADALKQIPAEQIKSVEVITSPSAKYDAEGTGGIINIITKKNNLEGASLNVNSSFGFRGSHLGLNAAYRKGRFGMTLGGGGHASYNVISDFYNKQSVMNANGDVQSVTYQRASSLTRRMFGRYNLGMDYEINKYNWINATVRLGMFNFNTHQKNRYTDTYVADTLMNSNLQDIKTLATSTNVDASLNYIKTFEKKGKEFSILTLYSENERNNDFVNKSLNDTDRSLSSAQKNNNAAYNKEFTVQGDYIDPINDNNIIEFGAKNIMRDVTSQYKYYSSGSDGQYSAVNNKGLNNSFDYKQNVTAGYVSYTTSFWKDYSAKIGGRYEYTTINAQFADETKVHVPNYGVFVPSINLSKKLSKGNTIKMAFNRRIQRPSLRYLNPNLNASNPRNISQGNPTLNPEYTSNYEIAYSTYKKQTSVNLSGFMRNTTGSIQQVRQVVGSDTILTTYKNIGTENAYGLSVFANVNLNKKLSLNGGIDSYYAVLNNNVKDPLYNASNQGFVISGRVFGSYKLTDKWALQAFTFMRGRQVQLQGYQTGFYIYSLSLNRSFKDDKGSIGFGAENFITGRVKMINDVQSTFINQHNSNTLHNLNFKINLSLKIGKMSVNDKRRQKGVQNNDLKDGDDNSSSGMK